MIWVVLASIIAHQVWVKYRLGKFDPLATETLLDLVIFIIVVIGSVIDDSARPMMEGFGDFGWMMWGGQIALYAGLHLRASAENDTQPVMQLEISDRVLKIAIAVSLGAAALIVRQNAGVAGGVIPWLLGSRMFAAADNANNGIGALFNNIWMTGQVGIMMGLSKAIRLKQYKLAGKLYFLLFFSLYCIFTTRFQFAVLLSFPIFYWHYNRRRLHPIALASLILPLVVLLAVLNMVRGGGIDGVSKLDREGVTKASTVLAPSYLLQPVVKLWDAKESSKIDYEYGLTYLYLPLTAVPRAVWSNKPLTSFSNRWTQKLEGSQTSPNGDINVWTYTAWGEGFGQFGVLGAILNLFLFGAIGSRVRNYASKQRDLFFVIVFFSIMSAVDLREGIGSLVIVSINTVGCAYAWFWISRLRYERQSMPVLEAAA